MPRLAVTLRVLGAISCVFWLTSVATSAGQARQGGAPTKGGQTGTVQVAAPPPPAPPPKGVIAGRVTNVITKQPLSRVRVRVSAGCERTPQPGEPPCEPVLAHDRVAMTGEDGRFRISELPVSSVFVVRAAMTGYAPAAYGELPPGTMPRYITLKQDEVVETIVIELAPEVVLSGMVQDEDGKPFTGALVQAERATYVDGRRELVLAAEAQSDDHGQFRLSQLTPGQYYVSAMDPAFAGVGDANGQLFYSPTYYPNALSAEDAIRITLDPGVNPEAIVIKLRIIRPSRVSGLLKPPAGLQLLSGSIELGPRRNDQYAALSNFKADIRPDGSYLFANVPPGRYAIRARGDAPTISQSLFGIYQTEVSGMDKAGVNIEMSPGAILSGIVVWEGRAPPPADRSTIIIRSPMTDGSLSGDAVTGNVQPDDTFILRGVLQGVHYIRAQGLPFPWSLRRVELNGSDITDIPVDFTYGQIERDLRVTFSDMSTEIRGSINLGSRDVFQGYAVVAFSTNPTTWYPRSRHVQLQRPTLSGLFRFVGLPPGEYNVAVTREVDEGDVGLRAVLQKLAETAGIRRVPVREGEHRTVELRPMLRPLVSPLLDAPR